MLVGLVSGLVLAAGGSLVLAQSSSNNYRVEETFFGTGGEREACSGSFCATQSAGELTVGNTAGGDFQAQAGFNTTDQPMLEFIVTGGSLNLGTLSTGSTATGTMTFSVRNYLSNGYVVTTVGQPPTNGPAQIDPLTSPTASSAGSEQFGMNLTANTQPTTFGANPTHAPDSSFSFGAALPGYNSPNLYKYVVGESVAASDRSSGQTIFTVSYIVNVSPITEGGIYETDQVFVVTGTY